MRKYLLLLPLYLFSASISAYYVISDPDGYVNVRKEPNTKSEILGTLSPFHAVDTPNQWCDYEKDIDMSATPNWMPILLNKESRTIGYVFKKNVKPIDELPKVTMKKASEKQGYFEAGPFKVEISEVSLSSKLYCKEEGIHGDCLASGLLPLPKIVVTLDGEEIYSFFNINVNSYIKLDLFECIGEGNKGHCSTSLYKGDNGVYYLYISQGDGGEHVSAVWIISRKGVVFNGVIGHCDAADTVLDPVRN